MADSYIRGLNVTYPTFTSLSKSVCVLRTVMLKHVLPMLGRWNAIATKQQKNDHICVLQAHIAMVLQNTRTEDLKLKGIAGHLVAHLSLNIRYTFTSAQQEVAKGTFVPSYDLLITLTPTLRSRSWRYGRQK